MRLKRDDYIYYLFHSHLHTTQTHLSQGNSLGLLQNNVQIILRMYVQLLVFF